MTPVVANANPNGGTVVAGAANIQATGNSLNITQASDRAIINWQGFSVGAGQITNFSLPSSSSATLNRVTGGDMSVIAGQLNSNGQVFLINPNGVLFGNGSRINVGGLTASTLDITNSQFMQGGDLNFQGSSSAGVINRGVINANNGNVNLIGAFVENHGQISAPLGNVNLGAGQSVLLQGLGSRLVVEANDSGLDHTVTNTGTIDAIQAQLIANGGNVYGLAVNTTGTIRANGVETKNGRVMLVANGGTIGVGGDVVATHSDGSGGSVTVDSGAGGTTNIDANIDVTSLNGHGGNVDILGEQIDLHNQSLIDASGLTGGGLVRIGGGFQGSDASIENSQSTRVDATSVIRANAIGRGDGGTVVLWSDGDTSFEGQIFAKGAPLGSGGMVEVSGKQSLDFAGTVDTGGGHLLLDPFSYVVGATEAANIVMALGSNNVTIHTSADDASQGSSGNIADPGDITVNSDILYDSTYDLTFLAHRHINFKASVQNSNTTSGDVNVVAGWDGITTDIATILGDDTIFGIGGGSVFVGDGTQTGGIAVGSRFGSTNVAAHDLTIDGSDTTNSAYAQLGFRVSDASPASTDGSIDVSLTGDLTANGGDSSFRSNAQLGHGGQDASGGFSGDITIHQVNDITFKAGNGTFAFAQLGHGGLNSGGKHSGVITIYQANDLSFTGGNDFAAYAQLGHGGAFGDGDISGNIVIHSAHDLNFMAGNGEDSYAQLGNGGAESTGNFSGEITISQANNLTFKGGNNSEDGYAQLGHGGYDADGDHSDSITVNAAGNLTFTGGAGSRDGYAQLGHGGFDADGAHGGAITVNLTGGDLALVGGTSDYSYAQIGHGDASFNSSGTRMGDIDIRVAGETSLQNGTGTETPWLIGHATTTAGGISNADVTLLSGTLDYDISTTSTFFDIPDSVDGVDFAAKMVANLDGGNVTLGATNGTVGTTGGMTVASPFAYDSTNNLSFLSTTDVRFAASVQNGATTMSPGPTGEVNAVAGWDGTTGVASPLVIGDIFGDATSFGVNDGSVFIGNVSTTTGIAVGSRFGPTNVAAFDLTIDGSNTTDDAFAQLGFRDTGAAITSIDGSINVALTGDLTADGGNAARSYAQVGHGGADGDGDFSGAITITSADVVAFRGGDGDAAYAQLGHGGTGVDGNHSGAITINQANILALGGDANGAYSQVGHGGQEGSGSITAADIELTITGAGVILLPTGAGGTSQIGHGGRNFTATASGIDANITVDSGIFLLSTVTDADAVSQIGHGGFGDIGFSGDINISSAIVGLAALGEGSTSQFGHGGPQSNGNHTGNITVTATGTSDRDGTVGLAAVGGASTNLSGSTAQIGHGGREATGSAIGDISVTANGVGTGVTPTFQLTTAYLFSTPNPDTENNFAQIGHGGVLFNDGVISPGSTSGAININAVAGGLTAHGGIDNAPAQIGHGGLMAAGNRAGAITVATAGDLNFIAGTGNSAYAQLGHGGGGRWQSQRNHRRHYER